MFQIGVWHDRYAVFVMGWVCHGLCLSWAVFVTGCVCHELCSSWAVFVMSCVRHGLCLSWAVFVRGCIRELPCQTISDMCRASSSSIHSTTLGGSWSVQQFYSIPVCPLPSPSNQQFSSSLGLLLPGPSTLTWVSLLVLFYMTFILLFFW